MMLLFGGRKEFLLGKVTEKTSLVILATLEPERSNEIISPKWHVKKKIKETYNSIWGLNHLFDIDLKF